MSGQTEIRPMTRRRVRVRERSPNAKKTRSRYPVDWKRRIILLAAVVLSIGILWLILDLLMTYVFNGRP